jgi:hypothetical protein
MLLTLLAVLSSTTLLVGSILAAKSEHAGPTCYVVAIFLGVTLAAANFWGVHKAGFHLARFTSSRSPTVQDWSGRAFCLVSLAWAACAEPVGFGAALISIRLIGRSG